MSHLFKKAKQKKREGMWWFVFRYVLNRELLCFTKSRQKRIPKNLQLCFPLFVGESQLGYAHEGKKKQEEAFYNVQLF